MKTDTLAIIRNNVRKWITHNTMSIYRPFHYLVGQFKRYSCADNYIFDAHIITMYHDTLTSAIPTKGGGKQYVIVFKMFWS